MTAEFHPAAAEELLAAASYYEQQATNLGREFIAAVEATQHYLCQHPDSGRVFRARFRRFLVRRFPYALIYHHKENRLLIVAVAHVRRRPGYWRGRD